MCKCIINNFSKVSDECEFCIKLENNSVLWYNHNSNLIGK